MILNFPNSPIIGDLYPTDAPKWKWDGEKWNKINTVDPLYIVTLPSVLNYQVENSTHNLDIIKDVKLYKPNGDEASVVVNVTGTTVNIESNIDLLDCVLKIF